MAYSAETKAEALVKLALNKHDFKKTADQMGISEKQLRRWAKGQTIQKVQQSPEKDISPDEINVPDLLKGALAHLLKNVPKTMRGDDWAVAVGILTEKVLLFDGMPTQRTETIERQIEDIPPDDIPGILDAAERILKGEGGGTNR